MTSTTEAPPIGIGGEDPDIVVVPTSRTTDRRPFLPLPARLAPRDRRIHQIVIALLLLFGLAQGAYWSVTTLAWSPVDELQHYGYVESLARGEWIPTVGVDLNSDAALEAVKETPTNPYRSNPYAPSNQDGNWAGTRYTYEAVHGPTYYVLMVPFYWIGQPLGTNGSLYAIRLATVGLVLCTIPLTWLLARRLFPDKPVIWLLAPALMAAVNSVSSGAVSNDAMAMLLATVTILWFLRALDDPRRWIGPALAGVLFGLTIVTKMTSLVLIPFLALAFLAWLVVVRPRVLEAGRWAVLFVGGAVAAFGPWLAWNWHAYHATSGAAVVADITTGILPSADLSLAAIQQHALVARGGVWLGPLLLDANYQRLWETVAVGVLVLGLLAAAIRRRWRDLAVLAWCGAALPLAFLSMETIVFVLFKGAGGPMGRHLHAALPPTMIMIAAATVLIVGTRWAPVAIAWLVAASLWLQVPIAETFIRGNYLDLAIDGTQGPVLYQDYSDSALADRTGLTIDVDCPVTAIGIGFSGPVESFDVTSPTGTAVAAGGSSLHFIPTYRLSQPLEGPLRIELPAGTVLRATGEDRNPDTAFTTGGGDPVVTAYCPRDDAEQLSFDAIYKIGHPDGITLSMLTTAPRVLAGAGILTATGLTVAAAVGEVRRRRGGDRTPDQPLVAAAPPPV